MAIDPPYRLDPFRNIINIHWETQTEQSFDGLFIGTSVGTVYGDYSSYGAYNDGNYYVYGNVEAPPYSWKFEDGFTQKQWGPVLLINNSGSIDAEAKVENLSSGMNLTGSWHDDGGQNPPYGSWGIDLSGVSVSAVIEGRTETMRVHHLGEFFIGSNPYAAWLQCFVHWSS